MEIDNIRTIKKKRKIKNIPSAIRSIFFNPINIIIAPPLTATKRIEFLGYIASDIFGSPFSVNVRKHRMAREAQSDIHPSENRLKGWMTVVRSSLRFARWLIVVNGRYVYARANGSQNAEPAWNTLVTNAFPPPPFSPKVKYHLKRLPPLSNDSSFVRLFQPISRISSSFFCSRIFFRNLQVFCKIRNL